VSGFVAMLILLASIVCRSTKGHDRGASLRGPKVFMRQQWPNTNK
jgi:hypothetical protein